MYLKFLKKAALSVLIFIVGFTLYYNSNISVYAPAFAQELQRGEAAPPPAPINLTLSPTYINLATDPGEEVSSSLRVTNNNAFTENLRLEIAKYELGPDGERLSIVPLESSDDFGDWVEFDDDEFSIASNQTRTVRFSITPPDDAALGYYYAFIIRRVTEQEGESTTTLTGAPAFTAVLEVRSPNAKKELQLVSFSTDKSFYEYLPTTFNITLKNTGNLHIVPSGNIFIDQGGRKDIAILNINEGSGNILPGQIRTYTAAWSDGMLVRVPKTEGDKEIRGDDGKVEYETKWDFAKADKFRIGPFKANLLAAYDDGSRDVPLEANLSFWIFPWKIVGIALIVLILAFLGLKQTVMTNVKKIRKK